jgi:hypothetical protein
VSSPFLRACPGFLLALLLAARASASEVELDVRDCPLLSMSTLRELVDIELATLELAQVAGTLQVRCVDQSAAISLDRSGRAYPVQVHVDLRDTARSARDRLVALAATELLAQAEREHAPREAASPSSEKLPAKTSPSEPDAIRVEPIQSPTQLYVAATLSFAGDPQMVLWGGSLGALLGLGQHWALQIDTRFERGQAQLELEPVDVRWSMLSGFVGAAYRRRSRVLELSAGLGVRTGWLAFDAEATSPDEGRSLTASWAGVALPLRLAGRFAGRVLPSIGAEGGYVVVPVAGVADDGATLLEQRGPWLALSLGLGLEL